MSFAHFLLYLSLYSTRTCHKSPLGHVLVKILFKILKNLFKPMHILVLQSSYFMGHMPNTSICFTIDSGVQGSGKIKT